MTDFAPRPGEIFEIVTSSRPLRFRVVEHPNAPGVTHSMKAGKATVYHLADVHSEEEYALKVMKPKYRVPVLEDVCFRLDALKTLPGLMVCERRCLSPTSAPMTVQQYANLTYAILMPWMQGKSWFDCLQTGKRVGVTFSAQHSLLLACSFARILMRLERLGIAHCDLSPAKMIVDERTLQPELIDVEDIYGPGFQQPDFISRGTDGYQHRMSAGGQWAADVDRFAGAIILSEILGWCDPDVIAASSEESYFDTNELQRNDSSRFHTLSSAVARHGIALTELLRRAWDSASFAECPTLEEWSQALEDVKDEGVWTKVVTPQAEFDPQSVWKKVAPPEDTSFVTWTSQPAPANTQQCSGVSWNDSANRSPAEPSDSDFIRWIK
jgi:hypothetical protein